MNTMTGGVESEHVYDFAERQIEACTSRCERIVGGSERYSFCTSLHTLLPVALETWERST